MNKYLPIKVFNHDFLLHPERVLIHPKSNTLFVADAHFGKSATFRQGGIPVPSGVMQQDLNRLSKLFHEFSIGEVFFLGDLFHSSLNAEWDEFKTWRVEHKHLKMNLIEGNHDILEKEVYQMAHVYVFSEPYVWKGIELRHHPVEAENQGELLPYLCGHVHPGVRMSAAGKFNQTLPCFYQSDLMFMLPAFGSFTGLGVIHPKKTDRIFVVAGTHVHEVYG